MIPLRDTNPRSTLPVITIVLIVTNVLVFLYQFSLGPLDGRQLIYTFGMVPARIPMLLTGGDVSLGQAFAPLLSSVFLHGGWLHLIGNMWFLWIFGDNIEDRLGHFKYLLFYLTCGVGAGVIHAVVNLGSTIPAVGASGAISAVLGAYVVLFPHARITTLVPLFFVFLTLRLPALVILGYWFLIQFLSGLASVGAQTTGGVAWWAHIGGFGLGALLIMVARRRQ